MRSLIVKAGALLSHCPYSLIPIIGNIYNSYNHQILEYGRTKKTRDWIYLKMFNIVDYAIKNIPFYKELYASKGFTIEQLRTFDDIEKIPIVTKKDLMEVTLDQRSVRNKMSYIANTGGSTGVPLSFFKSRRHQIKEMAYYYHAWSRLGFSQSDIRLQFVGRSDSERIGYDFTRNRLTVNIYMPFEQLIKEISVISKHNTISYLQGYPSVIYEFALFLDNHPNLFALSGLKGNIKGIFLNSEYPFPEFRTKIENVFGAKSIASYGHTEGCALAFDYGNQIYQVEQSYGFSEAKQVGNEIHLISTSYDNYASPFIRYDTGDIIDEANEENGILKSFRMTDGGRSGQYVLDKNGKKISLTGLIFGRHHKLFNYCSQIQIGQSKPGEAIVYYVSKDCSLESKNPEILFDTDNLDIEFEFKRIDEPIRTKTGKVLLLVSL